MTGATEEERFAAIRESNLRVIMHEAETPTRGHDTDGTCRREAAR